MPYGVDTSLVQQYCHDYHDQNENEGVVPSFINDGISPRLERKK